MTGAEQKPGQPHPADIALSHEVNLPQSEFYQKLENRWGQGLFVCVGLDSEYGKIPEHLKTGSAEDAIFEFNKQIIDATADLACAYKPNAAFYEAEGEEGMRALKRTIAYIKETHPEVPVILDYKRGDIGNTNLGYVKEAFDDLKADAVTVHGFLGREAMQPFLDRKDKGIIVLAKTSNPGSGEFQDLPVGRKMEPLYQIVARHVSESWNENGNCAIVVGATYPEELAQVRALVGDLPILLPGIGAQGGEVEATVKAGKDSRSKGMIINSSRGIIFASNGEDFAQAARKETQRLTEEINKYRLAA